MKWNFDRNSVDPKFDPVEVDRMQIFPENDPVSTGMRLKFSDGKFVDISFDKELSLDIAFTLWTWLQTIMGQEQFLEQYKDWYAAMTNNFFIAKPPAATN